MAIFTLLKHANVVSFPSFSHGNVDVNIWLVTFGFHLHNVIPGFPIPKFDLTQPSLEMMKSQLWDDLPVSISDDGLGPRHAQTLHMLQ